MREEGGLRREEGGGRREEGGVWWLVGGKDGGRWCEVSTLACFCPAYTYVFRMYPCVISTPTTFFTKCSCF